MSFENFYFSEQYKETNENNSDIENASALRNSLVMLHNQGIKTLSNSSSHQILQHGLADYSQKYNEDCDESCLNTVLGSVDSLLKGKIRPRHCTAWKSNLGSTNDPHAILKKSIEDSDHCNIVENSPCRSDIITENDIKKLLRKKTTKYPTSFVNKDSNQISGNVNNISQSRSTENIHNQNSNMFCNKITNNVLSNNKQNFNDKYIPDNTKYSSNSTDKFKMVNSNPMDKTNTMIASNALDKYNAQNQQRNVTTPQNNGNALNNQGSNSFFRTARTELIIQNKKKNGNNSNRNDSYAPEANVQKRSLGTTRSSVQSKFIPPMSVNNNSADEPPEPEEVEDERLRNIDPKMIELIKNEIIDNSSPVEWDDIAGLDFAKAAIQEAVVWPLLRPDIFRGLRRPPKGILLFGPPGTGKTLIGKCIASQCCATFFSISASSLTSKWIGDGEKMVRALFAVARCHQPAVVFIDEIDSLLTQRSDTEHEATRRIKTEFLVQLDGAATGDEDRFLVIGATNRPQELDEAARRRLVKRLYIPLPDIKARHQIIFRLMTSERHSLTDDDMMSIANLTDGFSGADMRSLCSEAALGPIRCVPFYEISNIHHDQVRPVNVDDFKSALTRVRPSVSGNDLEHYTVWNNTYGSGSNHN